MTVHRFDLSRIVATQPEYVDPDAWLHALFAGRSQPVEQETPPAPKPIPKAPQGTRGTPGSPAAPPLIDADTLLRQTYDRCKTEGGGWHEVTL
jgi:hypothetical protein